MVKEAQRAYLLRCKVEILLIPIKESLKHLPIQLIISFVSVINASEQSLFDSEVDLQRIIAQHLHGHPAIYLLLYLLLLNLPHPSQLTFPHSILQSHIVTIDLILPLAGLDIF